MTVVERSQSHLELNLKTLAAGLQCVQSEIAANGHFWGQRLISYFRPYGSIYGLSNIFLLFLQANHY